MLKRHEEVTQGLCIALVPPVDLRCLRAGGSESVRFDPLLIRFRFGFGSVLIRFGSVDFSEEREGNEGRRTRYLVPYI